MILLDTHALLWWQAGGEGLSSRAARAISEAARVLLCPVSFWEIGMLLEKGRISLDRDAYVWTADLLSAEQVDLAPLTASGALAAGRLPAQGFAGDPADAMLYATARELDVPLVSKDSRIREHARQERDLRVVW